MPSTDLLPLEQVLPLLSANGPLSRNLKGFEVREQQLSLLKDILTAYNKRQIALLEAGTGTGKSMAYLIPALLWALHFQEKTVLSTNTIHLQEQLLHKDIPLVLKALNADVKVVLVKGMYNYACLRKLADAQQERLFMPPEEAQELEKIEAWSQTCRASSASSDGSRASLPFMPTAAVWEHVGAESDNCTKKECPYYKDCFFFKARRQMNEAQLLIVNHHLLCSDLAARETKESSLLPDHSRMIIDEAHHLEDVATDFFANRFSQLEILRNLSRIYTERQGRAQGKLSMLKHYIEEHHRKAPTSKCEAVLLKMTQDLQAMRRDVWLQLAQTADRWIAFAQKMVQRDDQGSEIKLRLLAEHQTDPFWIEELAPQSKKLIEEVNRYVQTMTGLQGDVQALKIESDAIKNLLTELGSYGERLQTSCSTLQSFVEPSIPTGRVRWIEVQIFKGHPYLNLIDADLDVSKPMAERLFNRMKTTILCSATMTTHNQFDFVKRRLGILPELLGSQSVIQNLYASSFDYAQRALLVVPTDLPAPHHPQFVETATEAIWRAVQASRGNAFVLFTSYQMLKTCYDILADRLRQARYCPLKQGDLNRQTLIERFKTTDRSILFGTDSFWEGVDVVGEALRCVILVKLPFKVPSEPIFQARSQAIVAAGGDPFTEYALPGAIVKFKQGFGRLIRTRRDRGCVVCLDNRLAKKGYGRLFLNSLPNCQTLFASGEEVYKQMEAFYRRTQ